MATKSIRNVKLTDSLTISECKDGYWLYDYTRGMNLSMRANLDCPKDGGILVWIETTNTKSAAGILPKKVNRFMSYGNFTVQSLKYYHEKHK